MNGESCQMSAILWNHRVFILGGLEKKTFGNAGIWDVQHRGKLGKWESKLRLFMWNWFGGHTVLPQPWKGMQQSPGERWQEVKIDTYCHSTWHSIQRRIGGMALPRPFVTSGVGLRLSSYLTEFGINYSPVSKKWLHKFWCTIQFTCRKPSTLSTEI